MLPKGKTVLSTSLLSSPLLSSPIYSFLFSNISHTIHQLLHIFPKYHPKTTFIFQKSYFLLIFAFEVTACHMCATYCVGRAHAFQPTIERHYL
ncbi:hypothetical protein GQ43DRAFT_439155 [Delitschia confertaspora ATCC 74209]|uniref:Uncharacterized protein n=1 Tax=Delitschia confertaspora ATCC 74209 TaxID=1513339 RepID=A0A9P4MUI2_9PLEO|nr:hypothetical protein GQ43DRAFT_439155 [Delitschia confertaspora ATCC 74209]